MEKRYLLHVYFTLCFLSFFYVGDCQEFLGDNASAIITGANVVKLNETRHTIDFVKFDRGLKVNRQDHQIWLKKLLNAQEEITFELLKEEGDQSGYNHFRYKELYRSLPIEYGVYFVHSKNGNIESVNGEFYNNISVNNIPSISKDKAFDEALKDVPSENYAYSTEKMKEEGYLVIFPSGNSISLAYKFDIYSSTPLKRVFVYIDAHTGKKIIEVSRIHFSDAKGTAYTGYNGTVSITTDSINPSTFRLKATKNFAGIHTLNMNGTGSYGNSVDFIDGNNIWDTLGMDRYAYDAHFGAEATYDWYHSRFSRNSYDNAGAEIKSYVHFNLNYANAFWDGSEMTYGDGDGIDYKPFTSLEIVGHEITHAVTQNTADLVYADESGALNESFSDCLGVTIDYYKNPLTANFLIGEQVNVNGTAFRNMGDPNQFQNPDTYKGTYWTAPFWGFEVHINSGVQNFWFYLLCNGGSGTNDLGNVYQVNAIGINDASAIAYRCLSVYLTPNSNYLDARFYSRQAAIDLFGECSPQLIEVTNAWHAVGLGNVFNPIVKANFKAQVTEFCSAPAIVYFQNKSINASNFLWRFGDGTTDTSANPVHIYNTPGTYNVKLIATGMSLCQGIDSLFKYMFINVNSGNAPIAAQCLPQTIDSSVNYGILNVSFGAISRSSGTAVDGYCDFSCTDSTTMIAGDPYLLKVTTNGSYYDNVKAWIDYNNNGLFEDSTELILKSLFQYRYHQHIINTSLNSILNKSLRLRVIESDYSDTIADGCKNINYGQAEDYSVKFIVDNLPPDANFMASDTVISPDDTIHFSDLTIHSPSTWNWYFPGGTPSSSQAQNPEVIYKTNGIYLVKLVVSNSFGQDSLVKLKYIYVGVSINMCNGITITNAPYGKFYDSGGPFNNYQQNESCSLLIDPGCAESVSLSFSFLSTQNTYKLKVYDGTDSTGILLWVSNGGNIPPTLIATSGKIFIKWNAYNTGVGMGWYACWTSVTLSGAKPIAGFTTSNNNNPVGTIVSFNDASTNSPFAWYWDFGDGSFSHDQNPTHIFHSPGLNIITLIAYNCYSSDTVSNSITLQQYPLTVIHPFPISSTLHCKDSLIVPVTIVNSGTGDLLYSLAENSLSDSIRVLVYMPEVDRTGIYLPAIAAINTYFNKYTIVEFNSTDSSELREALKHTDVLYFPFTSTISNLFYRNIAKVTYDFASAGGRVIETGSCCSYIFPELGLFQGYENGGTRDSVNVLISTDELTQFLPSKFNGGNGMGAAHISNIDKIKLIEVDTLYNGNPNYDVLTYRKINGGEAIYLGFNYSQTNPYESRIISNAIKYGKNPYIRWLGNAGYSNVLVHPGDSTIIYVTLNSSELNAGNYHDTLFFETNDSIGLIALPINLMVTGEKSMAFSDSCLNFGLHTQNSLVIDTLKIYNHGCDSITFNTASISDSVFTLISPQYFYVAPGEYENLIVKFNSTTIGNYTAILSLFNNQKDTTICLNGSIGSAPVITIQPTQIDSLINTCKNSVDIPIALINSGGSNLTWSINGLPNEHIHILAMTYGVDSTSYLNLFSSINSQFTNYTVDSSNTRDSVVLKSLLNGVDVLIFPPQSSGTTSQYAILSNTILQFANSGGTVIVCGGYIGVNRIFTLGLFNGNYYGTGRTGYCYLVDSTQDISTNVPVAFPAGWNTSYFNITDNDKVKIIDFKGYDAVTSRRIGNGKAICMGFDFYFLNNSVNRLISNAIRFSKSGLLKSMNLFPADGVVSPGDTSILHLVIQRDKIVDSVFMSQFFLFTNDTANRTLSVPVKIRFVPCSNFVYDQNYCSSIIKFNDSSFYSPSSYGWNFGDGYFSQNQNPYHTFPSIGSYSVVHKVCNSNGCDSTIHLINIADTIGPQFPDCIGSSTYYCCDRYIKHVVFNTIDRTNTDSIPYIDFSCTDITILKAGLHYPITITTGGIDYMNVRTWIDYNNNGKFNNLTEKVFGTNFVKITHSGNIFISGTAIKNVPLRMRIAIDINGNNEPLPCKTLNTGQFEDFTVIIRDNDSVPLPDFAMANINKCNGVFQFNDSSQNAPTSWHWTFGDGNSSNNKNPIHQYFANGAYLVKLFATNSFGIDSVIRTITISSILDSTMTITGSQSVGSSIHFDHNATGVTFCNWSFGDGYTSSVDSPNHIYNQPGTYPIQLVIYNSVCNRVIHDTIVILPVGINEFEDGSSFTASPNPFHGEINLSFQLVKESKVTLKVLDLIGQTLQEFESDEIKQPGNYNYLFKPNSEGMYLVVYNVDGKNIILKIANIK